MNVRPTIVVWLMIAIALLCFTTIAKSQIVVKNYELGTGIAVGGEGQLATALPGQVYHVPQYMPMYPTAASIWPRVVEVECDKTGTSTLSCDGYHWIPKYGRGEYLFIVPKTRVVAETVIREVPVVVLKEVPPKKKGE